MLPILENKCFVCHGPDVQEADIRLDNLSTDFLTDRAAATAWHEAMHVLNKGEMPPKDADPLTAKERSVLVGWIRGEIDRVKAELKVRVDRVVLRQLNAPNTKTPCGIYLTWKWIMLATCRRKVLRPMALRIMVNRCR